MKLQILRFTLFLLMCLTLPLTAMAQIINYFRTRSSPVTVREAFELDPFYQQWIDVEGLPVVASAKGESIRPKGGCMVAPSDDWASPRRATSHSAKQGPFYRDWAY